MLVNVRGRFAYNRTVGHNVLEFRNRAQFREWLFDHASTEDDCYLTVKRGKPQDDGVLYYLDAVEEALCFGWIDSIRKIIEGREYQRFSPRKKHSPWSELNKERVRRLEKLGLMTKMGKAVLPKMGQRSFHIDEDVEAALKKAKCWAKFKAFPTLYQRIRAYNVAFYKKIDRAMYEKALNHLIQQTRKGLMFGEWNDYGRLLDY